MNPLELLKMREDFLRCKDAHPKFMNFLRAVSAKGLAEGTVMEITVTEPDGSCLTSNLKLTETDVELIRKLSEMKQ